MTDTRPPSSRSASVELPAISLPSFSARHELQGEALVVYFHGNADSEVADELAQYLERMHLEVVKVGLRQVVLDFRELYFLTSSCIKCLVVLIKRVVAMEAQLQYEIALATQPSLRWQERSFEVLCQLAPVLVRMKPR